MCSLETEDTHFCSPQGLLLVAIIVLVFGILSAIPLSHDDTKYPGYPWLLLCQFGVGFGAGGDGQG